jgi:dihydroorotate dehydrogenase
MSLFDYMPDFYRLIRPFLFEMDPEDAHAFTIKMMHKGLIPRFKNDIDPILHTRVCGIDFPNPVGLAAGFDKQAEVISDSLGMGFGFVEVGGVVPLPQSGNPKPRVFRVPEAEAIINRFNFNSDGFDVCERRIAAWYDSTHGSSHIKGKKIRGIVGINIAKGDHTDNAIESYILGLKTFAPYLDFITINVSCPNTKKLEGREQLSSLLLAVMDAHKNLSQKPRVFVKISPDQTPQQQEDIAEVVLASSVHGMIVGNTSKQRPPTIPAKLAHEAGGLSGKPLFAISTELLANMYRLTKGKISLIGCGGISSGQDAYTKIRSGASLLQVYTALVYKGPFLIPRINRELTDMLKRDGFKSVHDAVGVDVH